MIQRIDLFQRVILLSGILLIYFIYKWRMIDYCLHILFFDYLYQKNITCLHICLLPIQYYGHLHTGTESRFFSHKVFFSHLLADFNAQYGILVIESQNFQSNFGYVFFETSAQIF